MFGDQFSSLEVFLSVLLSNILEMYPVTAALVHIQFAVRKINMSVQPFFC